MALEFPKLETYRLGGRVIWKNVFPLMRNFVKIETDGINLQSISFSNEELIAFMIDNKAKVVGQGARLLGEEIEMILRMTASPPFFETMINVSKVVCGNNHTVVIAGNKLYTFGSDARWLGRNDAAVVGEVMIPGGVKDVFVSGETTFAVTRKSPVPDLYFFGNNANEIIGSQTEKLPNYAQTPILIPYAIIHRDIANIDQTTEILSVSMSQLYFVFIGKHANGYYVAIENSRIEPGKIGRMYNVIDMCLYGSTGVPPIDRNSRKIQMVACKDDRIDLIADYTLHRFRPLTILYVTEPGVQVLNPQDYYKDRFKEHYFNGKVVEKIAHGTTMETYLVDGQLYLFGMLPELGVIEGPSPEGTEFHPLIVDNFKEMRITDVSCGTYGVGVIAIGKFDETYRLPIREVPAAVSPIGAAAPVSPLLGTIRTEERRISPRAVSRVTTPPPYTPISSRGISPRGISPRRAPMEGEILPPIEAGPVPPMVEPVQITMPPPLTTLPPPTISPVERPISPRPVFPLSLPPVTLPPVTLPPVTLPPITLRSSLPPVALPPSLPPVALPLVTLPLVTLRSSLPPVALPPSLPPPSFPPVTLPLVTLRSSLPPVALPPSLPPVTLRSSQMVRCRGLTQKETQCTRMVPADVGYCWQHIGQKR